MRIVNITLSQQGKIILTEHKKKVKAAIQETMSYLSDEELDDVSNSLRKLRDILIKL
jgi:DNA-binding MarR family transcriptional regulator